MDRRSFLKRSAAGASVAAYQWSGASRLLANDNAASKGDENNKPHTVIDDKSYRHLMGLGVSPIGLGCLPMVGYYGGKYDKNEMIALIRRAYDKGVTFFDTAEVYGPYT
ncbi:MAG: aldo/keto reductase, partial [Prevotella sp.]